MQYQNQLFSRPVTVVGYGGGGQPATGGNGPVGIAGYGIALPEYGMEPLLQSGPFQIQTPPPSGPTVFQIAVDVVLTLATAISRIVNRVVGVPLTLNTAVVQLVQRLLNVQLTLNTAVLRTVVRAPINVVLTLNTSVAFARILNRAVAVALTLNTAVTRQVNRTVLAPLTMNTAVSRRVNRIISAPLTMNSAVSFSKIGGTVTNIAVNVALTLVPSVSMHVFGTAGAAAARARKWFTSRFGVY